jgi:hypothetical protein
MLKTINIAKNKPNPPSKLSPKPTAPSQAGLATTETTFKAKANANVV